MKILVSKKIGWVGALPLRAVLAGGGIALWLATASLGQSILQGAHTFVEDDASLVADRTRRNLERELEAFSQATDCWILVKTLEQATEKKELRRMFGEAWSRWGSPECAVVFFFIREQSYSRMMLAPGMESRLSSVEIGAILRGVVVPRFTTEDPEGAVLAGVESLQVALTGELLELPSTFRPRGRDRWIGVGLVLVAASAFSLATWQVMMVFREKNKSRSAQP